MIEVLRSTGKEKPVLGWLAGRTGLERSGAIMPVKNDLWQQAEKQAAQIKKLKTKQAKSRQAVLLCETWKRALKGGK